MGKRRRVGSRSAGLAGALISRRLQLDDGSTKHFYLMAEAAGPGTAGVSIEQLARPITARHGLWGKVELDDKTFQSFVDNFNGNAYGQEIYLDRAHNINDGVNGKFKRLFIDNGRLLAEIEWTERGVKTYRDDGFIYFSIDFTDDYIHPETGKSYGPLLFGAALTPRPFIKNMTPSAGPGRLTLSEGRSVFVPDYVTLEGTDMKKYLEQLRKQLAALKLSDALIGILLAQFEAQSKALALGDDEGKLKQLGDTFVSTAQQLAEQPSPQPGTPAPAPAGVQLTETQIGEMVRKALADAESARANDAKKLADSQAANRKAFCDAIDAAKGLSDATKQSLKKQADAINGTLTADQVKTLADSAIELGNQVEVQQQRMQLGLGAAGRVMPIEFTGQVGQQLGDMVRGKLKLSDHANELQLTEEKDLAPFARKVLAHFDQVHGYRIEQERKLLAGDGSTNIADGEFPVAAQRQVILELLADLKFLALVQTLTDPSAQATTQIPYEVRNTGTVRNGGRVYEGQGIRPAGVTQAMDLAYIEPRKIAMIMSNEMIHFSRSSMINWDAWARNIASNARLLRDLIAADIANMLQRAADSFEAVAVASEVITAQVNGTRTVFKTANFPVVRPHQPRDLQGNTIGSVQHPIAITQDGSPALEYDGTGEQAAGVYYQWLDYNLGYFQFVDEAGDVVTLANATVTTIDSYSYATNVDKFDIDNGSVDYDVHLNGLLNRIGRRKAMLQQQRFVMPNFGICSSTLHNTITEAKNFEANSLKEGTGLNSEGDLERVKAIPMFGTNQPGVDLGDSRILIGERQTGSYVIAKPWSTGTPFEAVDSNGRPTAQKVAYGEEYSSLHVPAPIRNRMTSIIVYSATARAAV